MYLFLVTVSDARGLSYYADASIMQRLSMDQSTFESARDNLLREELIAFKKPLYQVLSLDMGKAPCRPSTETPLSLGEIFKKAMGGA